MNTLAVVSGAAGRRSVGRPTERVPFFLALLEARGPLDVVIIHAASSRPADRRRCRDELLAARRIRRTLEVSAPRLRRSGLLRDVHIHRDDHDDHQGRDFEVRRHVDAFASAVPEPYDLVWCSDIAALARATGVLPAVPAVVDIDVTEDLSRARARRAARRWACIAHLVTVPDQARRAQLAMPGSRSIGEHDGPAFVAAAASVVAAAEAYRPVRTA